LIEAKLSSQLSNDIPWMMIYGSNDRTTSEKHIEGTKKKFLPQLEIVRLDGIGHWVMIEAADKVTKTVTQFLKRHVDLERAKL
jgi:soluble epoxide hydrolase/lipid-phosphate phosphatase